MKFKNNQPIDVYVDLGTLRRVTPGEIIELHDALVCPGLTPIILPEAKTTRTKKVVKKKPRKSIPNIDTSGTI